MSDPLSLLLGRNSYLDSETGLQEVRQRDQQLQAGKMQLDAAQQKQAHEAGYQQDVLSYFNDPKPNALGALMLKYPDKADEIKQSKAVLDEPARQSQLTQFSSLHNAVENNRSDLARTLISNIHAAERAKGIADPQVEDIIGQLDSKDPAVVASAMKQIKGFTQINLAALDPKFAEALSKMGGEAYTLSQGQERYDGNNRRVASVAPKPDYLVVPEGGKAIPLNGAPSLGMEGGGQTSSGSAAGTRGDVSRLINTDAGGGYVPDSVNTLGQFVGFGKSLNQRGAKSSSAGTYQINGTTMAEFAPKVFGPEWKSAPFNAETQDRVGQSIFNWAKQQRDPAAALRGRWVSLDPKTAERLVQGDWQQARGTIAQKETGGAPGASAARGASPMPGDPAGTVYGRPKAGYQMLSPEETSAAGLDPNVRYQRSPDGQITMMGGQARTDLKPIPSSVGKEIITNRGTLRQIDAAISELAKNPSAIGPTTGMLGDWVTNTRDPKGVAARAAIGKIGGQIIHDVSGAAVTLSEEPRFKPYVPLITDPPGVAKQKLQQLRNLAQGVLGDYYDQYSEAQGYRPFANAARSSRPATTTGPAQFKILRVRAK